MVEGGWSEDSLHRWLTSQAWPARLVGSRGHDAAVLKTLAGLPVICTDQCIEGVHYVAGTDGWAAGRKAGLRTLSDLAATAAAPVALTLALRAPATCEEAWLRAAIEGVQDAASRFGAELVAGDLAAAPGPAALAVTALGCVAAGTTPVGRDRAQLGQVVVLTGPVGGSLVRARHMEPVPRVDEGRALAASGATAMMDVSDGLALDLFRLARASGVRIALDLSRIPIHDDANVAAAASGRTALEHALHDGEDHELIATIDAGVAESLGCTVIGRVVDGRGLLLAGAAGDEEWSPTRGGWTHGGSRE